MLLMHLGDELVETVVDLRLHGFVSLIHHQDELAGTARDLLITA